MKPAPFDYVRPASTEEALAALSSVDDAKFIAGGQSLVPIMNLRMARPELLIDLNGIGGLDNYAVDGRQVRVGAMCRHRYLELDDRVRAATPLLHQAAKLIGHPAIRNRGTLGGSLVHADPAAELPVAILALDAQLVLRSAASERVVAAADFFEGFFMTAAEPHEILSEVILAVGSPSTGTAFEEFAPRHGDFALVGVAAVVEVERGCLTRIRLAGGGIDSRPTDLSAAARFMLGECEFVPAAMNELATRAAAMCSAETDTHASGEDRRELVQLLCIRAVKSAWTRATGESTGGLL